MPLFTSVPSCRQHASNMAAPAKSRDAAVTVTSGQSASASPAENVSLQYSLLLEHLIGDKRQIKDLNPTVMGPMPSPHKTEEQKMIERGMESCAFKSLIACVGGISVDRQFNTFLHVLIHTKLQTYMCCQQEYVVISDSLNRTFQKVVMFKLVNVFNYYG